MKSLKYFVSLFLLSAAIVALGASTARDELWKKFNEAKYKGLPKSAIEQIQPIIDDALKNKDYADAAKAVCSKQIQESRIQGNKPEEKITRLEADIEKLPAEMKPVLTTILANWYWQYFQQNRWRFMNRTATSTQPGKDFTTWDLKRLFAEIDKKYQTALTDKKLLQSIPITNWNDLIEAGTMPDAYRPTLFDFLAFEAISFYSCGEQAGAKPEDSFEILSDSPIFDTADKFMAWKPDTSDTDSPDYKAILLFQDILKFHMAEGNRAAFISADLDRIEFASNKAVGESKDERYKKALQKFITDNANHELSALAIHHLAQQIREEGDLVEAHKTAKRGADSYSNSPGGKMCQNLIIEIESKSVAISTEYVWNRPAPTIDVKYRNMSKVYFRLVPFDWDGLVAKKYHSPDQLSYEERKEIIGRAPAKEWSVDLAETTDFKERTERLPAPLDVKPGFYFVIASVSPDFKEADNILSMADICVSTLAVVYRCDQGTINGFVLEAESGEPISGAEIRSWYVDDRGNLQSVQSVKSDDDGIFRIDPPQKDRPYFLKALYKDQVLSISRYFYVSRNYNENRRPEERTMFFTDRSIYRPGQTIQYKGICMLFDTEKNNYQVLKDRSVNVVFRDSNGKEIARQTRTCNDYGSFSGSFTSPRDTLMGYMSIIAENPNGYAGIRVEEYKRPKFQVTLEAPKTQFKLNDKVTVSGKAMAYSGAAIDGANVKFRVVRGIIFPPWCSRFYCWMPWFQRGQQEIAHGKAKTDIDGSFKIEFTAKPDLSVPESTEAAFSFLVYADVTDTAGETRSDSYSTQVGYVSMRASIHSDEWLTDEKPVEFGISTTTLDGVPEKAEGVIRIHSLKEPEKVVRGEIAPEYYYYGYGANTNDMSNPENWPLGDSIAEQKFLNQSNGHTNINFKLKSGFYRAIVETKDAFGKKVTAMQSVTVYEPSASKCRLKIPNLFAAPKWSLEPGEEFTAIWGTGYEKGQAFIEVFHDGKPLQRFWTKPRNTQNLIKQKITEEMRGGISVCVTYVRENRSYSNVRQVYIPWNDKSLSLKWEHFTSKLEPNKKESWTAVITGVDSNKAAAEMVATLYDKSLDQFMGHYWQSIYGFKQCHYEQGYSFANSYQYLNVFWNNIQHPYIPCAIIFRHFPYDLTDSNLRYEGAGRMRMLKSANSPTVTGYEVPCEDASVADGFAPAPAMAKMEQSMELVDELKSMDASGGKAKDKEDRADRPNTPVPVQGKQPDLSTVAARKNLNETAFFFPHLISDSNGVVKMEFTMPEALTTWRFMGFAHDKQLRSGMLSGEATTSKELMVQPNPPRFLREGDIIEFTVKVTNLSDEKQEGAIRLSFSDANTGKIVDDKLGNNSQEELMDVPAKQSKTFSWKIKIPDGLGTITYKAVASTGKISDGEEGFIPVLSKRILVTESLPLPIRGPAKKEFNFQKLIDSKKSDTLKNEKLVVQMVSQPAWYAVMALPYLMEYPYECAEQTFNRVYANTLASHIAKSDPKIEKIFEQWRNTPALDSPLMKNQDLKSVMIEETPWLVDAQNESQARRNVGILFDNNRLASETSRAMDKLLKMQYDNGAWPWFPGGPENQYMTLYIMTGFGRLRHLGTSISVEPALKSINFLDEWIVKEYNEIVSRGHKDHNNMTSTIALYLYGRSFFLKDRFIQPKHKEAIDYFLDQAKKHWLTLGCRQSQAHTALALWRFGDKETPKAIIKSIKEHSVTNEEMGMFWRDTELSWWWYQAPIETQAMMVEALDEIMNDAQAVEDCKVWLIKQKQTQNWKTTKATADAVYALLLKGEQMLSSDAIVEISLAGVPIKPENVEAGTGFYEKLFTRDEIKPEMGKITVTKTDKGVSWGSVNWQYLEDMSKVTPYEGTPLKLKKSLYKKENTVKGPVLEEVKGPMAVGDEIVVRIELRVDRDMEYVHMKDQRGSGHEPVNVLSQYKHQDGLAYYESTRDTASHFFIDYLPKGTYVFEYSVRVQLKGEYQTGVTEIQCMYAPEFNSHSESIKMEVK